jgi:hypothetical protein
MRLGKRQRVEEPFAGLHDVDSDPDAASFVVYGVAATLHPLDQTYDDEGAELVPLPGSTSSSTDPILVDRFDCRLLLEPSDLIDNTTAAGKASKQRNQQGTTATEEELELDELRWRDFFNPPHLHQHQYSSEEDDEAELRKRTHGAAIPFTYSNPHDDAVAVANDEEDGQRVYYLEDLEPPPPPLYLETNQTSLLGVLKPSSSPGGGTVDNFLPYTSRQYAIMERTADFLRMHKDSGGAEILYQRAFSDPTFSFISPDHIWNGFFKGLVESDVNGSAGVVQIVAPSLFQKQEKEQAEVAGEENLLGDLLGGYGSDQEEETKTEKEKEQGRRKEEEVVKAIITRLLKSSNKTIPLLVREILSKDPVIASIIHSGAPFYHLFQTAVDGAVAVGAMDGDTAALWLYGTSNVDTGTNSVDGLRPEVKKAEEKEEPQALPTAAQPVAAVQKKERKIRNATAPSEIDESKKEERKKKAKLLLERQRQVEEERKKGQAAAKQEAEEERNQRLASISIHKRMFLDNSDDE